ncbi:hypothetical protein [Sphingobium bisphenolivorans]|uniref:hypothetical protein n=1 Tax=Sphingobium bisphenolivorans TaxID=1335760 RepID=UPI00039B534D|nr:hypothetical protein [Sphingobium bisphenolivorans]
MERVELELIGNEISITIEAEDKSVSAVRRISATNALTLATLLSGEAPELTLNIDLKNGVWLQRDHWPHQVAFLEIARPEGGRAVAFLEGSVIQQIGQCLHRLYLAANGSTGTDGTSHVFSAAYCYPEKDDPRDQADQPSS